MILSVSRRTDIPACYADWFFNRLQQGFSLVRNPMNPHQVKTVSLAPEAVSGIVFWSKNPAPMLDRLHLLKPYAYYFQFTLTPYGADIEPNLPDKLSQVLPTFRNLSEAIGANRVIWRYDPVLLSPSYSMEFHLHTFESFAKGLEGYAKKCIFSFVDDYKSTLRNREALGLFEISEHQKHALAEAFSKIAQSRGITLETCAEQIDLSSYQIGHARCVDADLIASISGHKTGVKKAEGQRQSCGCAKSTDIGVYNSCKNGCLYCYANYSVPLMQAITSDYDPLSPLLCGRLRAGDKVLEIQGKPLQAKQLGLFD